MTGSPSSRQNWWLAFFCWFVASLINPYVLSASIHRVEGNLKLGLWVFVLLLVALGWVFFLGKIKVPKRLVNWSVTSFTILFMLALTVLVDRWLLAPAQPGLIFAPGSVANYETSEFSFTAQINSLGLRDHEYPVKRTNKQRLLVFGDSFTFGWGVELEDTWVKLVEQQLNAKGLECEMLNCGQSGRYTRDYLAYAQTAIPLLQPDAVVIALYQGNDLYQSMNQVEPLPGPKADLGPSAFGKIMQKLYPNLLQRLQASGDEPISIQPAWLKESSGLIDFYGQHDSLNSAYQDIDTDVREAFEAGKVNPGVINGSVMQRDRYAEMADFSSARTQAGIDQMKQDLKALKALASQYGCEVILLSVPHRVYVSSADGAIEADRLKMIVPDDLIEENQTRSVITQLAVATASPYLYLNDSWKDRAEQGGLYYPVDGHFTVAGNHEFAELVARALFLQWGKITGSPSGSV